MSYTEKAGTEHLKDYSRNIIAFNMTALRTCKDCGLQALTISDLNLFRKVNPRPYGRANWCKKCYAQYTKNRYPPKKMKEAIDNLEYPAYCYFCGEEITKFKGIKGDCITIHSLDGNHNNWSSDNKVPAHRRCHTTFHSPSKYPDVAKKISKALTGIKRSDETKMRMSEAKQGANHPRWQGDDASKRAKWMREYRRRKKEHERKQVYPAY